MILTSENFRGRKRINNFQGWYIKVLKVGQNEGGYQAINITGSAQMPYSRQELTPHYTPRLEQS
jgi:hypothetical protein